MITKNHALALFSLARETSQRRMYPASRRTARATWRQRIPAFGRDGAITVKSVTVAIPDTGYRVAPVNSRSITMESGSLKLDERILSPAQRSARCFVTLFCFVVLAAAVFCFSRMDNRAGREKSTLSTTLWPEIERQGPLQENQKRGHGKLASVLTPPAETPVSQWNTRLTATILVKSIRFFHLHRPFAYLQHFNRFCCFFSTSGHDTG
jgi:hypothetical protein